MHAILARGRHLALYVGLWLLVGLLLAILVASQVPVALMAAVFISLPLAVMFGFVCLSAWYVARSMPLGGTGVMRISATVVTAAVASSAAWLVLARAWMSVLQWTGAIPASSAGVVPFKPLLFGFGLLLYVLSLAVSYIIVTLEHSRDAERRGFEVQVFAREAELRSLRAQIDPHFLFNSLHSISALTSIDPLAARRMCVLLGDFLRESIALGGQERITIEQEFRLAGRYLDIEKVRFGDRLQVAIDAGDSGGALVPPLLLQPMVENAVTHGIAHTLEGGTVRVEAVRTATMVRIVVENPCDPDRPRRTGTGVGLANVRSRLRALHGPNAQLTTTEQNGSFTAEIALPVMEREGAA